MDRRHHRVVRRALVYRDHVYDDTGAETGADSPHGATTGPAAGDVDHRAHGQQLNSADLLVLRLHPVDGGLHARFELNTLFPGDPTIAAVAIDLDDSVATGGGRWPGVAVRSAGWDVATVLDTRDPEANVIEGLVPAAVPASGSIRIQAVVALGDGTPMNVAFRAQESGDWWDVRQATALAAGDVSRFGTTVDVADLRAGLDAPAPLRPGLQDRVHWTAQAIGEGVAFPGVVGETTSQWTHLGHHQPYALYVPDPIPRDVQLVLHGATASHTNVLSPGMRAAFGDRLGRLLVAPYGRGDTGGYLDWSAHDVLDALADVETTFATDPDTVVVSGYSMGGGGALHLAAWFPDRFAAVIGWVPFTGDCLQGTPLAQGLGRAPILTELGLGNDPRARSGCPLGVRGNTLDLAGNLRHVPTAMLFGILDELVWVNHPLAAAQRFTDVGVEHRIWLQLIDHFLPAVLDDWTNQAAWSAGRRRPERVAKVDYRTNTFAYVPELGLVPDGAYWVDGIVPRNRATTPDGDAVVSLLSHACPSGGDRTMAVTRDLGLTPLPWIGQRGVIASEVPDPNRGNPLVTGSLLNVAEVEIDVDEACIGDRPVVFDVEVDGPTVVRFSDGRPAVVVEP